MAGELLSIVKDAPVDERPARLDQSAKLLDGLSEEQRKAAFEHQARRASLQAWRRAAVLNRGAAAANRTSSAALFASLSLPYLAGAAVTSRDQPFIVSTQLIHCGACPCCPQDPAPHDVGHTALHAAAALGWAAMAALLLECGCPVVVRDRTGATALATVAAEAHLPAEDERAVMQLLLDRGADIDAVNANGARPLMLAAGEVSRAQYVD